MEVAEQKKVKVPKLRFREFQDNWQEKKLGQVSKFLDSKRVPISESERSTMQGCYPYYGASGIIDYVNDYIFDGEYVLLGEDGANILTRNSPLAFVVSGKVWINNHAHVLQAEGSNTFLAESLERLRYDKYNTGTAQPKLNAEVCKNIEIAIPSLPEQQKIAGFLSAVDEKLQHLNRKKELLQQYKKGVMQKLFSQELRFKGENGSDYEDWEEKRLDEVATFYNGRAYKQDELLDKGKYTVLRVGNFFTNENWYYSDLELEENKYCNNGDLLYAWSASFGPRIWEGDDRTIYHYHIWKVDFKQNVTKEFLFQILKIETEKMKAAVLNGFALQHITKGAIEKWKCFVPSIPEQQKIADFLSSLDEKIDAVSAQIEMTQQFKKGLLQEMFV